MSENFNTKEVILHIGIGKTGTSSIQKMLYDNRNELEKQGYYYPDIGIYECAHHYLAAYRVSCVSKGAKKLLNELVTKFEQSDNNVLLLSSEQFCFCKPSYIIEFAEYFSRWPVKVIFYVRRQEDLIPSAFLQHVKQGGDYHGNVLSYFKKCKSAFDFNTRLETWASVLGVKAIDVRLYHTKEEHYDVRSDFMRAIHIKDYFSGKTEFRSNRSLLPEFAELVSLLDSIACTKEYRTEIIEKLEKLSGIFKASSNRMLLSNELRPHVNEYYRRSNEAFASKYLNEADSELFLG